MTLNSLHLPVQTHHNNFKQLQLSNFFGKCEETHGKLHSIVLTLLTLSLSTASRSLIVL